MFRKKSHFPHIIFGKIKGHEVFVIFQVNSLDKENYPSEPDFTLHWSMQRLSENVMKLIMNSTILQSHVTISISIFPEYFWYSKQSKLHHTDMDHWIMTSLPMLKQKKGQADSRSGFDCFWQPPPPFVMKTICFHLLFFLHLWWKPISFCLFFEPLELLGLLLTMLEGIICSFISLSKFLLLLGILFCLLWFCFHEV